MSGSNQAPILRSPLRRVTTRLRADDDIVPDVFVPDAASASGRNAAKVSTHGLSAPMRRVAGWKRTRHMPLLILASALASCTATGDFGRPAPSV
jgi:hypothetical protein